MDRFIDQRSRLGKPPTRLAHSLFRVISGQLAAFRADLGGAVAEAHWGAFLPWAPRPLIAKRLHVSVHTVRTQVATLREKFQASTRAELVRKTGSYGALP